MNSRVVISIITCAFGAASALFAQMRSLDQGGETCASAFHVPAVPFVDNGFLGGPDDCPGAPLHDVFYQFTAPYSGNFTASTCGSLGDTYVRVWLNGICCSGASIISDNACDDDAQLVVPLTAAQLVFFECGHASAAVPPGPYVFQITGTPPPPPCSGIIQSGPPLLHFPPTHVGSSIQIVANVVNLGNQNLCVDSVRTNGHVFSVSPTSFQLPPGQLQLLQVTFSPTFEWDFNGVIECFSSDPARPRDSILVSGTGCHPVASPPAPTLLAAGSPTDIYFAIPANSNSASAQFAVEFSSNGFGSSEFLRWPHGISDDPDYATASQWGIGGGGVIAGLAPNTPYSVRLRVRDCVGAEIIGPAATLPTEPAIVLRARPLVAQVAGANTINLWWDASIQDTSGRPVSNRGWNVLQGRDPDHVDSVIAVTDHSPYAVSTVGLTKGFFAVEPRANGLYDELHPFISWPPNGATIAGQQTIELHDFLHAAEWDSFRIETDSMGIPILVGSNVGNLYYLSGLRGAELNFSSLGSGLHTLTATIVDHHGIIRTSSITVNAVTEPYSSFTASYNALTRRFSVQAAGIISPFPVVDFLWLTSHVAERYGSDASVEWLPSFDTLSIVKVIPQLATADIVWTPRYDFRNAFESACVVVQDPPARPANRVACCCDTLVLRTDADSGWTRGHYEGTTGALGQVVTCNARTRFYQVGFGFEVEAKIKYTLAETEQHCLWGQDAQGTRAHTRQKCNGGNCEGAAQKDTSYQGGDRAHRYGGAFGNDGYGPRGTGGARDRGARDHRGLPGRPTQQNPTTSGLIRWYDQPADTGRLDKGQCIRLEGSNRFRDQVTPPCAANNPCCKQWDVFWDVTLCMYRDNSVQPNRDSCKVTVTTAPHLVDGGVPNDCPPLVN